LICCYW